MYKVQNHVFGRLGNVVPLWRRELDFALFDHFEEFLVVVFVEGRVSAE